MHRVAIIYYLLVCVGYFFNVISLAAPPSYDISILYARHNEYRAIHNASPLQINKALENEAQRRANTCQFVHNGADNLATFTSNWQSPGQSAVDMWYDEHNRYNYNGGYQQDTGHFTQMVWKSTTQLGCGISQCPGINGYTNGFFVVCVYDPPGNVINAMAENVSPPL